MSTFATKFGVNVSKFSQYDSVKRLRELAQTPFDLTAPESMNAERIERYVAQGCGFRLLYATERVDEDTLQALRSLAVESQALDKMRKMQEGEVLNRIEGFPSEQRAVLHTAMRDVFETSNPSKVAGEAASLASEQVRKLQTFNEDVLGEGKYTDLIMVGIGGSDLGPRAIYHALEKWGKPSRRVHFLSNVDPDDAAAVLAKADLPRTLVVVVSKSGTTLETLTNEEFVRSRFRRAGLDPQHHFVAVTGKGSPMDDPSRYLESFYIWDYVGGRFSSTSMVGGVMLTFGLGFKVFREFLEGAHEMDRHALTEDPLQNLPLLSALLGIWNRNFLGYPTVAVIPYAQPLHRFPAHLQQCDMESNGKQIELTGGAVDFDTGPVVWGEPGTNGQHSFFQLIHQGTTPVPVEFIGFRESQFGEDCEVQGSSSQQKLLANLFAQALGLAQGKRDDNPNRRFCGNRPSRILLGKQLTPHAMGALLAYYEHKTAFQGFIWNINSFDQEGVQLGKVLAKQLIDLQTGECSASTLPAGSALLKQVEAL